MNFLKKINNLNFSDIEKVDLPIFYRKSFLMLESGIVEKNLEKYKLIQEKLLEYLDNDDNNDENFQNLKILFINTKVIDDQHELRLFLQNEISALFFTRTKTIYE